VSQVTDMQGMLSGTAMSTANYDATLNGWAEQDVQSGVEFEADSAIFCSSQFSRQHLIDEHGWTITDGGREAFATCPYVFVDSTIHVGVDEWIADSTAAALDYGSISGWDVSGVTDMDSLFTAEPTFNDTISNWDVSGVTTMEHMFDGATSLNQDLSSWDISAVTSMDAMFDGAALSIENYDLLFIVWSTLDVASDVQLGADGLIYCAGEWDRQELIDSKGWVIADAGRESLADCPYFVFTDATIQGGVDDWDSDVTQATLDYGHISTWDVSQVTHMDTLFQGLSTFNDDISNWDISGVTTMENMLDGTAMSYANYDSLLVSWSQLTVQPNVTLGASGVAYCTAMDERNSLMDDHGWIFVGDLLCVSVSDFTIVQEINGEEFHMTQRLQEAVDYYNEVINASPPATLLDFVRGEVVGDQVYMTVSLQAIIEAIQAGGLEE